MKKNSLLLFLIVLSIESPIQSNEVPAENNNSKLQAEALKIEQQLKKIESNLKSPKEIYFQAACSYPICIGITGGIILMIEYHTGKLQEITSNPLPFLLYITCGVALLVTTPMLAEEILNQKHLNEKRNYLLEKQKKIKEELTK